VKYFEKIEGLREVSHIKFQLVFIWVSLYWNLIGRSRVEDREEKRRKTATGHWTGRWTGRDTAQPLRPVLAITSASDRMKAILVDL
jgi:hypothetical protein